MLQKPEISAGLMGHLARMQTLPLLLPIKHGKGCVVPVLAGLTLHRELSAFQCVDTSTDADSVITAK